MACIKRTQGRQEWLYRDKVGDFSVIHEKYDNCLGKNVAVEIQFNGWVQGVGAKPMGPNKDEVRRGIKIRPMFLAFVEHFIFYCK